MSILIKSSSKHASFFQWFANHSYLNNFESDDVFCKSANIAGSIMLEASIICCEARSYTESTSVLSSPFLRCKPFYRLPPRPVCRHRLRERRTIVSLQRRTSPACPGLSLPRLGQRFVRWMCPPSINCCRVALASRPRSLSLGATIT